MALRTRLAHRTNWVVRRLARSSRAVRAAVLVRNQCNMLIGYHLAPAAHFGGDGEEVLLTKVAPHVGTFIDIGANVGDWTNALLARQPDAVGVLIEPTGDARQLLTARVPSSMRVLAAAAGAERGTITFYDEGGGSTQSSAFAGLTTNAVAIEVPVTTIDSVLADQGWDSVDLVKIDAQGNDGHILRGAAETLARGAAHVIQFEYADCWILGGSTLAATIEMLRGYGYDVWVLKPDGVAPYDHREFGEFFTYSNFVATTPTGTAWMI
jgi:FkbM family methyltransferase